MRRKEKCEDEQEIHKEFGGNATALPFTCASTLVTVKRNGDGTAFLKSMTVTGTMFGIIFMILQLISIPGLPGVHFGKESYIMLAV